MDQPRDLVFIVAAAITLGLLLLFAILTLSIFRPWLQAMLAGGQLSAMHIVGMRLRGTPVEMIVHEHIAWVQAGVDVKVHEIESQYLASKRNISDANDLHREVEKFLKAEGRL